MQLPAEPDRLVVIVGPTGVGKTSLAISLAEHLRAEIISADSRSFYRGMDIGTAKPSVEDRRRVPHHLVDVADPDETWSLALFQAEARKAIEDIHARGSLPVMVGGTGQYIRAVTEGWTPPVLAPDARLRMVLEDWAARLGADEIHRRLSRLDPAAAAQIDPHNIRRTIRALEVIFQTGVRFSDQRSRLPSPYTLLQIGLTRPRPELYARIDERIDAMVRNGLLDEVRELIARGYLPDLPSMSAIGYREMAAVLAGQMSMDEAIMQMKRLTRVFIRRQANWFKESDPHIHWFDAGKVVVDEIAALVSESSNWVKAK